MPIDPSRLGGVSILTVTPLDSAHRLIEKDFISLLDFITAPVVEGEVVAGVTVCGEMGEGYALTDEDKARVIRLCKRRLGPSKTVIAAVFALSERDARHQARLCAEAGADALMVAPVAPFPYAERPLLRFFEAVGAESGLPLVAYLNKMYKPFPPDAILAATYALHCVAAIKDSTGDAAFFDKLLAARPAGKLAIQTVTGLSLSSVRAGADGLMIGTSNLLPKSALQVWAYGRNPDPSAQARAQEAQDRLLKAAQIYKVGAPSSKDWVVVKEALAATGVIAEAARHPAPPYELLSDPDRLLAAEQARALSASERNT